MSELKFNPKKSGDRLSNVETAPDPVRERPILFSGPMVRAILEGRKTQTRRVVKFPHGISGALVKLYLGFTGGCHVWRGLEHWGGQLACPYGEPGDRLWVREAFTYAESVVGQNDDGSPRRSPIYRAGSLIENESSVRWRPSIHMPRWASRITLELTEVRVERVQDISYADVLAEGCPLDAPGASPDDHAWYRNLWDSLNADRGYGWDVNPWVWVLSFKRVTP